LFGPEVSVHVLILADIINMEDGKLGLEGLPETRIFI
jgi:hypothetical protein